MKRRVDSEDVFPDNFIIQLFIQGLRFEFAVNVQASEPADLDTAIKIARKWETEKLMASDVNWIRAVGTAHTDLNLRICQCSLYI